MQNPKSKTPTTETRAASEALVWENSQYYENAEKWTWLFWSENKPFLPLFRQLDIEQLLELACGHGRHSEHVLSNYGDRVKSLIMMDILQSNVDWCLKRIPDQGKVGVIRNQGTDFRPVEDASLTGIFCYDAMVHFHGDVVQAYLKDAQRVLRPGGKALIHHSNYSKNPDVPFGQNPHARAFMSAALFKLCAGKAGLEVLSQNVISWGKVPDLDCLTLLRKT